MPSFDHMAKVEKDISGKDVMGNEFVLKMVKNMRSYHEYAFKQTLKNKERLGARARQPLEFVEYEVGQKFFRVRRPISNFKSTEEKKRYPSENKSDTL